MNHQVPDELISAYFDGEVTPDERGLVERLLETSTELRQQLDETSKLSGLLHSFPREAAPREFAVNVQKQIQTVALAAAPPTPSGRRSLRREWTAFGAGMLATMASLLVFVAFNKTQWNPQQNRVAESEVLPRPMPLATANRTEALDRFARAKSEFNTPIASIELSSPSEPSPESAESPTLSYSAKNDEKEVIQRNLSEATANFADVNSNSLQPQTQNDFLLSLTNGDVVVPRIADPSNTVAVVDFTVVDIDRGADELKFLLQKRFVQQIESGDGSSSTKRDDAKDVRAAKPLPSKNESAEFQVFFVRAPGDQLAGTIDELIKNHPDIYRNWAPQLPIELPPTALGSSEGIVAQQSTTAPSSAKSKLKEKLNENLRELGEDPKAVTMEADMAVGVLMARNSSVNASGDPNLNQTVPLRVANSLSDNPSNLRRKTVQEAPPASQPVPNLETRGSDNNSLGIGNTGQGYFRVSRENQSQRVSRENQNQFPLQEQTGQRQNTGIIPFQANQTQTMNLNGGANFRAPVATSDSTTNYDSRNSRFVRMLIVLKSEQPASPSQ